MTDDKRLKDPLAAAEALPQGSAVILRHRDDEARSRLGEALARRARRGEFILLVAGDVALARRLDAHGVHFPESQLDRLSPARTHRPDWIITAAAHTERALLRANALGADAAILAPLFPTKSHPGQNGIGVARFRLAAARSPLPVYALGGVTAANVQRLAASRIAGIAAISGLCPD